MISLCIMILYSKKPKLSIGQRILRDIYGGRQSPKIVSRIGEVDYPKGGGDTVKDRKRQRANRRLKNKEEMLDKRNGYGAKDLTAYNAVAHMKFGDKATVVLK